VVSGMFQLCNIMNQASKFQAGRNPSEWLQVTLTLAMHSILNRQRLLYCRG
jgi:hypothetical protein